MKNLFEQSRSHWVRYDRYELKTAADGKRYITPGLLFPVLLFAGDAFVLAELSADAKYY